MPHTEGLQARVHRNERGGNFSRLGAGFRLHCIITPHFWYRGLLVICVFTFAFIDGHRALGRDLALGCCGSCPVCLHCLPPSRLPPPRVGVGGRQSSHRGSQWPHCRPGLNLKPRVNAATPAPTRTPASAPARAKCPDCPDCPGLHRYMHAGCHSRVAQLERRGHLRWHCFASALCSPGPVAATLDSGSPRTEQRGWRPGASACCNLKAGGCPV